MTLIERLALAGQAGRGGTREPESWEVTRRFDRWRSLEPFREASLFSAHLNSIGASEAQFLAALSTTTEALAEGSIEQPDWVAKLTHCYEEDNDGDARGGKSDPESNSFLTIAEPLLRQARASLQGRVARLVNEHLSLPFDPDGVGMLFEDQLRRRILWMITRTLVLELQAAGLAGHLEGATPEERFRSFLEQLGSSGARRRLLGDYPVLARQTAQGADQWVATSAELLERLTADRDAMRAVFSPDRDPGPLRAVSTDVGDRHGNGRSVAILTFASGARVVYKPRSLNVDRHWNALLEWVGDQGFDPRFRTLRLLERDGYGWVEFASALPCTSPQEVRRFYERQGGYLALLYMLDATDFHHENVIAAGEHPVLLDVETVLSAVMRPPDSTSAHDAAGASLARSVLRTGLLPMPWGEPGQDPADFSGLGGMTGQISPYGIPQWEHPGSDAMQFIRKPIAVMRAANRPSLNGAPVALLPQADAVARGFCDVFDVVLKHRHEFLAADGPVAAFEEDEVRVIMRATRTYARLLEEGFHPDVLRDALERDWLFSHLWLPAAEQPALAGVIAAERQALWRGDVPRFTTRPGSHDLWTCSGDRIPHFLSEPPIAGVRRRVNRLALDDREKQVWLIRAAIVTESSGLGIGRPKRRFPELANAQGSDAASLIAGAAAIGNRLEELAVRGDDDAAWVGLSLMREDRWSVAPLGPDLYDGTAGIALFLAYLGHVSGCERYVALAHRALATVRKHLADGLPIRGIGAFDGLGGIVYAFSHLATLWKRPDLAAEADDLAVAVDRLVKQDTCFDIVGGAAGAIGGLASLHAVHSASHALRVARRCGDRLIAEATPMAQGVGWINADMSAQPMAGFSHGVAGIAWALALLATVTGDGRYRDCARAAVDYERSLFDPVRQNWPDLRGRKSPAAQVAGPEGSPAAFLTAWCHGAAGVALARLHMLDCLDEPTTRAEIDAAIATTIAEGFGDNHSLCHGDLGNLDVLLQAEQRFRTASFVDDRRRAAALAVGSIKRDGWICGIPLNVESPGLMTGLAGIGYGLLRLSAPDRVPSVLALATPPGI